MLRRRLGGAAFLCPEKAHSKITKNAILEWATVLMEGSH